MGRISENGSSHERKPDCIFNILGCLVVTGSALCSTARTLVIRSFETWLTQNGHKYVIHVGFITRVTIRRPGHKKICWRRTLGET